MRKNKLLAYVYMPIIFSFFSLLLLALMLSPFYKRAEVVYSAVSTKGNNETTKKKNESIFKSEAERKKIEPINNDKELPSSKIEYPKMGTQFGMVIIDKFNVQAKLIYGDSAEDLRNGVGQFNGSVFPGEKGTTLIGGHNTNELAALDKVVRGDQITIQTNYETYKYKVTDKKVLRFDDPEAIKTLYKKQDTNKVIFYTCYPIDMIGLTDERLFVYADLVSGKMINAEH